MHTLWFSFDAVSAPSEPLILIFVCPQSHWICPRSSDQPVTLFKEQGDVYSIRRTSGVKMCPDIVTGHPVLPDYSL